MRLLILPSWYPCDIDDVNGVFFRDQAIVLANQGTDVTVLAPLRVSVLDIESRRLWQKPWSFEDDSNVATHRRFFRAWLPLFPYGNALLWKRAADRLLHDYIARNGCPDLVHAHSALYAGWCAAAWRRKYGLPFVLTEHRTVFSSRWLAPWHINMTRRAVVEASGIAVVSPSLGALLARRLSLSEDRWRCIPNVLSRRFASEARRPRTDRTLRFSSLGVLTHRKGFQDLIRAYASTFGDDPRYELVIGGDGPKRRSLQLLSQKLGLAGRVTFLGRVDPVRVSALMASSDVFVLASHYETFGVVIIEALASGIPVVATRCGGPESILQRGDGILVAPGDPDALGKAMSSIAHHFREFDSDDIANRARERFAGEAVVPQLLDFYETALDRQERSRAR